MRTHTGWPSSRLLRLVQASIANIGILASPAACEGQGLEARHWPRLSGCVSCVSAASAGSQMFFDYWFPGTAGTGSTSVRYPST